MEKPIIHLLPNAHIDPVWMWNWQEGLSEGLRTCRTMLELMEEYPDLTFIRGESALYEHIEKRDPATFQRIAAQIAAGRWDPVGGQYIQPDNNLPSTWTALRQFKIGRSYFLERFGVEVRAGWLADAFGHGRGTPEIFTASGLRYFAFCRPQERIMPIGSPIFFWRGQGGSELLCLRMPGGAYASERAETDEYFPTAVLDRLLPQCGKWPTRHHALAFGLGDHGGGATRKHLDALQRWRASHPEVEVRFSTLHAYFAAVEAEWTDPEVRARIPVFSGEVNFCQRGCYSAALKLKRVYRVAERTLERSTRVQALLGGEAQQQEALKGLCFNAFHDILPGTLIESAAEEQIQWLGGVTHAARKAEFDALCQFGAQLQIQVPPVPEDHPEAVPYVLFNPRLRPFKGQIEIEFAMDYRPVWTYQSTDGIEPIEVRDAAGRPLPYQVVATEHHSLVDIPPWRRRIVFDIALPPGGWQVVTLGYRNHPELALPPPGVAATAPDANTIENGFYRIEARPGETEIRLRHRNQECLGQPGLRFATFVDREGSWGNMSELPENSHALEEICLWRIGRTRVVESGPERARLWVEVLGQSSRLELTFTLSRGREVVELSTRLYWLERSCRLKMLTGQANAVTYDVPGGTMTRGVTALVPGGRHQRVETASGDGFTLISDTCYGFENEGGHFAVLLARGARYCTDEACDAGDYPDHPGCDNGELKAAFEIAPVTANGDALAEELEIPILTWLEAPHPGTLPPAGTVWTEAEVTAKLCDLQRDGDELVLTCQNRGEDAELPLWKIIEKRVKHHGLLSFN